eukprot:291420-Amphidinium_carterae.2
MGSACEGGREHKSWKRSFQVGGQQPRCHFLCNTSATRSGGGRGAASNGETLGGGARTASSREQR